MESESSLRFLLVEDDPDDQFTLKWIFKKAKVSVPLDIARDGREALDYLSTKPRPDLVFLDLKLPVFSGFEVLAHIRATPQLADLPVAILSGSDEQRDHDRATELGVSGYLVKPPTVEAILDLLGALQLSGRSKR